MTECIDTAIGGESERIYLWISDINKKIPSLPHDNQKSSAIEELNSMNDVCVCNGKGG